MPQSTFLDFCREQLPPAPARLLEVGCGHGELTTALSVDGYDVLGIDPLAPPGDRFRRVRLEDLEPEDGPFEAVVAAHVFHHVRDLDHALDRVVALLRPGGVFAVDEVAWDLMDDATIAWLFEQRQNRGHAPESVEDLRAAWEAEYLGIHGGQTLVRAFDARFVEHAFERAPYLYRKLGGGTTEVLEQSLIDASAIRPLGFCWAGVKPKELLTR